MKTLYKNCFLPLSGGEAFCVEAGRFVPCLPPYGAERDLGGAAVLPAFLDAHSHILAYALSLLQADGAGCTTAEAYAARAEAFLKAHRLPLNALVTVKNADAFPDADALDAVPLPLHLQARSGHAGMFNAAARERLRIPRAGVLEESEYLAAARRVPMPDDGEILSAFRAAQEDYLRGGVCLAQEGYLSREMFPVYRMLCEKGALRLEIAAYPAPDAYDDAVRRFKGAQKFFIGGMKIFLDGSPQQKTAFLREPYLGGGYGTPTMTEAETADACRFAAARKAQLLAHCNGDGAAERFLSALAALSEKDRRSIRPVLIHGQIVGDDQLARARTLGVTVSFFPAHIRYWGETHLRQLGETRAKRISPAGSALRLGVPFTLHQDAPVCAPRPLEAAACAVLRKTQTGRQFSGQEIGVRAALLALTEGAAAQYGMRRRGRIAVGMQADFLITDDPFAQPPAALETLPVRAVYARGERIYP